MKINKNIVVNPNCNIKYLKASLIAIKELSVIYPKDYKEVFAETINILSQLEIPTYVDPKKI